MALDIIDMHGIGNAGHLVQLFQVTGQIGIIGDAAQITFEMPYIHRIEPHKGGEQAPVRFGQGITQQITPRAQALVHGIQRIE